MDNRGSGWLAFAFVMMVLAGVGSFVWGITAIVREELLEPKLVFANLTFWGIVFIVVGVILVAAGIAVLSGALWGRMAGLIFSSISIVFYMSIMQTHPWISVTAVVIDALVIYALTVHGGQVA